MQILPGFCREGDIEAAAAQITKLSAVSQRAAAKPQFDHEPHERGCAGVEVGPFVWFVWFVVQE
jgi:hypothetical protein